MGVTGVDIAAGMQRDLAAEFLRDAVVCHHRDGRMAERMEGTAGELAGLAFARPARLGAESRFDLHRIHTGGSHEAGKDTA